MSNLMDFLGQIEKLAYSLAVWIILIPKTIFKIILEPTWVRGYIAKEFAESAEVEKTGKSGDKVRFDDYVSPVILLLLCSLVPYVGYQLLPPFGLAGIVGTDTCVVNQPCSYDIDANYFDNAYVIDWQFRDLSNANVDNQHETVYANSALSDDNMTFRITGKQEIQWTTPGDKEVSIQIKDGRGNVIGETYRNVTVVETQALTQPSEVTTEAGSPSKQQNQKKVFTSELQKNGLLGVIFLVPALTFALAARGLKGQQISAEALKEAFYAQCYYFTPISLFTYIVLYATYFLTDDLSNNYFYSFVTLIGVVIWFVVAEVHAVAKERDFKSYWPAFWIVAGTSVFLLGVGVVVLIFVLFPDSLRWLSYQVFNYGVIALVVYSFIWRRFSAWWKNRKNKKEAMPAEAS